MSDLRTTLSEVTDDYILSSIYEIEDILLVINRMSHQVEYYKELKKHRIQSIDDKIKVLSEKEGTLRKVILNTMQHMNEKSLDFPDVGRVSRRKPTEAIAVEDQDKIVAYLQEKGLEEGVAEQVWSINKRKLNSLIGKLEKQGEEVPGITKKTGSETLSVTLQKPKDQADEETPALDVDALDALDALTV